MKVGIAQIRCSLGDIPFNVSRIRHFTSKAKQLDCEAVVFPEMSDTGYDMKVIQKTASSWNQTPFTELQGMAKEFHIHLISGLSEREGQDIFNATVIFDPAGKLLGRYRKIHLFPAEPVYENRYCKSGDSPTLVQIGDMKWGFIICYDLRFPDLTRNLALKGAEAIVVCSAWPASRILHWTTLLAARAIENQAYVVAANRVGTDNILTFCGHSRIIDPTGLVLVQASESEEEIVVADIDRSLVLKTRETIPVLK